MSSANFWGVGSWESFNEEVGLEEEVWDQVLVERTLQDRASPPQTFGARKFFDMRAVLCMVGCDAAPLASTH